MQNDLVIDLVPRQQGILREVLMRGACSRSELYTSLGLRKNTVTNDVAMLIDGGFLRECDGVEGASSAAGRPRTPVEVDPDRLSLVGVSIKPGRVSAGCFDLRGRPLEPVRSSRVSDPLRLVTQAEKLMGQAMRDGTVAVGLSVPGFLDPDRREVLFSAAWPASRPISLERFVQRAGGRAVVVHNSLHAISAQWQLLESRATLGDHLLVSMGDGELGAALLIDGRPNAGCLPGANELGHTRLDVPTPRCYCGQTGCLERICSTAYLRQLDPGSPTLRQAIRVGQPYTEPMQDLLSRVARGVANAINFSRVGRVTLACDLGPQAGEFVDVLAERVRAEVLVQLLERCQIDAWVMDRPDVALDGAALAMSRLYLPGW